MRLRGQSQLSKLLRVADKLKITRIKERVAHDVTVQGSLKRTSPILSISGTFIFETQAVVYPEKSLEKVLSQKMYSKIRRDQFCLVSLN